MKYFTISELCESEKAVEFKIENKSTPEIEKRLESLVDNVLDPLRTWYGKPINVSSGYRCPELNRIVGGSKTSQHMKGEAADITVYSRAENKKLFDYIKDNLPYDQLIDEKNFAWVHVSYRSENENRKQILAL